MLCVKCKAELPEGAAFCPYCGKRQEPTRRYRKRSNGSGSICKLSGNRKKPWAARKSGVLIGTYETRGEAQKALDRLTDQAVNDKYNLTFADVYERWRAEHEREIGKSTARGYAISYKQCQSLHSTKMRKILRSDYQAAIITLESKGMSKSSCQKLRVLFCQLGAWAMNEGITLTNPAEGLTTAAKQKSTRAIFLEDDIRKIKEVAEGESELKDAAQIAMILISCGCRPGELFSAPLICCRENHIIWGSKTEAGKNRVIPIGTEGLDYYRELKQRALNTKGTLLIDGYSGNHSAANYSRRDFAQLMKAVGLPDLTPYNCRHTFITRAITGGMDLPKLEAIVGHVDRETTKIYTHMQAQTLVEAVHDLVPSNMAICNKSATREKTG